MDKKSIPGFVVSILVGISVFFIPFFTDSPNEQVWVMLGVIGFVFLILLFIIVSNKFKEFNIFINNQEELNKKNEERFKIYERLSKIEAKLDYFEKKSFKR